VAAGPLHPQAQVGGVGAAARLGQRDGDQRLSARQARQPRPRHFRLAVLRQDLAVQRRQQIDVRQAEIGARDLFVDHARGQAAQPLPAAFLRQLGRDEAQTPHLAHDSAVQRPCRVALQKARRHAPGRKTPGMLGQRRQVLVDIGIHLVSCGSPDMAAGSRVERRYLA
jgi:hypothetical protein